jgi:regulatory protein YycH of two-component signal transduction system YycFG
MAVRRILTIDFDEGPRFLQSLAFEHNSATGNLEVYLLNKKGETYASVTLEAEDLAELRKMVEERS